MGFTDMVIRSNRSEIFSNFQRSKYLSIYLSKSRKRTSVRVPVYILVIIILYRNL